MTVEGNLMCKQYNKLNSRGSTQSSSASGYLGLLKLFMTIDTHKTIPLKKNPILPMKYHGAWV